MSNYQMLRAVAIDINEGRNQWILPTDDVFWDHLVDFLESKYDASPVDIQRARQKQLPRCFCPIQDPQLVMAPLVNPSPQLMTSGDGSTALHGDYWSCSMASMAYFWSMLWQSGNRGRLVMEFQQESVFGENDCYALPGDGGGFYAVVIELGEEALSSTTYFDDRTFYEKVEKVRKSHLQEALVAEGVEKEEELEDGSFYWSARDEIGALNMHRRMKLIAVPELGLDVMEEGFL